MPLSNLILLLILFFATSVVGVVTGSNSLVTVPVMFQFGIDEKVAVATNMFGLTFMAIGGTIPFLRQGTIQVRKLTPLVILTLIGSAIGAPWPQNYRLAPAGAPCRNSRAWTGGRKTLCLRPTADALVGSTRLLRGIFRSAKRKLCKSGLTWFGFASCRPPVTTRRPPP